MNRKLTALLLCVGIGMFASACATKKFVREQVGATETKLSQRADTQDSKLRETSDRTAANSQALDTAGQRIQGLEARVGEAGALAGDAKRDAGRVADAQREAENQFTQRFANRNKYSMVETKSIYFDFNKADLRDDGINELEDVAKALTADPNAVLELQGFADPRGSSRYNYQLTRDRVDTVVRHLVQRYGIDLRRIYAVGMGKVVPAVGEKPTKDSFAKSRRVEMRLLAPQS
jgi:outer membrane protein OmpA-like peptidoglycan-associated protein